MWYKIILLLFFIPIALDRIISIFVNKEKKGNIEYVWTSFSLIASYIVCIFIALFEFFSRKSDFNLIICIIGLLILLMGILLRKLSIKRLKDNWSLHIKNFPDQQLIDTGLYKSIRHPYYVAVILELVGTSFYFNSVLSLVYIILIHFPLLLVRIFFEEKTMNLKFHNEYELYRKKTGMFLPKL